MLCRRPAGACVRTFSVGLCLALVGVLHLGATLPFTACAVKVDTDAAVVEDAVDDASEADAGDDATAGPQEEARASLLQQRAETAAVKKLEVELEERQKRMEVLERAETETLLREQVALEALQREQTALAAREVQLEATQKAVKKRVNTMSSEAVKKRLSLMQELHNEWYHRAATLEDNSTEAVSDANETSNATATVLEMPTKNKLLLTVINVFGLGFWGVDRCYMDQVWLGIFKAVTIGGFTMWAFLDYVVLTMNALSSADSIDAFGFYAKFDTGVNESFWLALGNILFIISVTIFQCVTAAKAVQMQADMKGNEVYEKNGDFGQEIPPAAEAQSEGATTKLNA